MIGFTMTPSHIDYSKIINDKTVENLIAGDCVIILAQAKENTPVDLGELKNSEMWAMSNADGGFNDGSAKTPAPSDSKISKPNEKNVGYVGSGSDHAAPVELGRADMPNYPRQPYLRPAVDTTKKVREARRKQVMEVAIKQAYHG